MANIVLNNISFHQNKDRIYRHDNNPFVTLTEEEVRSRYRFNRDGIAELERIIGGRIQRSTRRNHALTPRQQICSALRFYASGSFQEVSSHDSLFTKYSQRHPVFTQRSHSYKKY